MATYESGRESLMLDAIINGSKTVEGRLNKGKFAKYKVGDYIWLRRDFRDKDGVLHDGPIKQAKVKIIGINNYKCFYEMVESEGYKNVIPNAKSKKEAAGTYCLYYSKQDQDKYGVLGIKVELVNLS